MLFQKQIQHETFIWLELWYWRLFLQGSHYKQRNIPVRTVSGIGNLWHCLWIHESRYSLLFRHNFQFIRFDFRLRCIRLKCVLERHVNDNDPHRVHQVKRPIYYRPRMEFPDRRRSNDLRKCLSRHPSFWCIIPLAMQSCCPSWCSTATSF